MFNKDVKVPLQEAELVGTSSSNMPPLMQAKISVLESNDNTILSTLVAAAMD